jgi:glutathione-independent formaldehyde dehydrogenase
MKAVVFKAPKQMVVEEVPNPQIENEKDVIVKVTSAAICGSDLHMYDGHSGAKAGTIPGHEPMGVVDQVGENVELVKKGDRVVVPFNVACGVCFNCTRGYTNACLTMNSDKPGAAYGYPGMGPYKGGQAEYVRVPNADWACLKLPGKPFDDMEDDFVLLADIFPTAYHATVMARVETGSTVAIFGAGPVGLLAAYSSKIRGASEIYVVDSSQKRLSLAESIGAIPVDFTNGDPVQQILTLRKQDKKIQEALRPGGEKMPGVMCGIDAVGYQAKDRTTGELNPVQVISDLARVVNPTGKIGVIGVYTNVEPRGNTEAEKKGWLMLPWGDMWEKNITIGTGQAPVKKYQGYLRDLIISGKAKPSFIVSDHCSINDAPDAYAEFSKRDKMTKPIIQFK